MSSSSPSSSLAVPPRSLLRPPATTCSRKRSLPLRGVAAPVSAIRVGVDEIVEIAHNKALVSATVASAIGQLSKPLTSALKGNHIDLRAVVRSGGMPSTHSASVVAAATSLGLERGFSDSIFGMAVVFAGIIMYDAQGVRREVGNQAKILNNIIKMQQKSALYQEADDLGDSKPGASTINSNSLAPLLSLSEKARSSYTTESESYSAGKFGSISSKSDSFQNLSVDDGESPEQADTISGPLNESVGHTEIQVIVGALLGFMVSLAIDTVL